METSSASRESGSKSVILRIDSVNEDEEEMLFYAALRGNANFPLNLFDAYTRENLCEENIRFYRAVETYRTSPGISLRTEIMDTFIRPGSPEEVNVKGTQRGDLLRLEEELKNEAPVTFFDVVQLEVVNLLQRDVFPRFRRKLVTANLNETTAREALYLGVLCFVAAVVILIVIFSVQSACDPEIQLQLPDFCASSTFFTNRLWRLLASPFIVGAVMFIQAGRTKFCPICAVGGATHLYDTPKRKYWFYIVRKTTAESRVVVTRVLIALKAEGRKKIAIACMITVVLSCLLIIFPPNNPRWY